MTITYNKIRTRIHLDRITSNYRLLCKIGGAVIPVIKADAYGHGLVQVARVLAQAGAETFAVGTVEEGVKLRLSGCAGRIVSLLGPLDGEEYDALFDQNIIPFVGGFAQLEEIHRRSEQWGRPLPVSLKFDTGMARLGFVRDDLGVLLERLKALPGVKPVMASSHLATADDPEGGEFVREQGASSTRPWRPWPRPGSRSRPTWPTRRASWPTRLCTTSPSARASRFTAATPSWVRTWPSWAEGSSPPWRCALRWWRCIP